MTEATVRFEAERYFNEEHLGQTVTPQESYPKAKVDEVIIRRDVNGKQEALVLVSTRPWTNRQFAMLLIEDEDRKPVVVEDSLTVEDFERNR